MREHPVEIAGLSKRYGDVTALDDCTFSIRRGEVFGLLGPNGSGKTTLLRLLMGFLRPTAGEAVVDGFDCYRQSPRVHARVAYLPGDVRLFRRLRGREVLRFFSGVRPDGDFQRAMDVARRLDLDLTRQVARSSSGMRQKLALAAVLSFDCPLLILDEPTNNLDPTARAQVAELIQRAKSEGRTTLFSSHVLSEVEEVCDRVALLRRGRLAEICEMSQLRRWHRITARTHGKLPPPPESLHGVEIATCDGRLQIETAGELAPLLSWLASLSLTEIRIEPLGLKGFYEELGEAT